LAETYRWQLEDDAHAAALGAASDHDEHPKDRFDTRFEVRTLEYEFVFAACRELFDRVGYFCDEAAATVKVEVSAHYEPVHFRAPRLISGSGRSGISFASTPSVV
jgi:hypothetical protein